MEKERSGANEKGKRSPRGEGKTIRQGQYMQVAHNKSPRKKRHPRKGYGNKRKAVVQRVFCMGCKLEVKSGNMGFETPGRRELGVVAHRGSLVKGEWGRRERELRKGIKKKPSSVRKDRFPEEGKTPGDVGGHSQAGGGIREHHAQSWGGKKGGKHGVWGL